MYEKMYYFSVMIVCSQWGTNPDLGAVDYVRQGLTRLQDHLPPPPPPEAAEGIEMCGRGWYALKCQCKARLKMDSMQSYCDVYI